MGGGGEARAEGYVWVCGAACYSYARKGEFQGLPGQEGKVGFEPDVCSLFVYVCDYGHGKHSALT